MQIVKFVLCFQNWLRRIKSKRLTSVLFQRKQPRKMASENINCAKFTHAGPLVLDARLRGPVAHALDDTTTGATLTNIQFDPKLNEIVDIGSNIEQLNVSFRD
ncbi:hypothetical protein Y032_0758g2106 [Ancylostoma ceylanicum]|uniref:Uncharacterized protein n=1 Tax=Ancylostoma ceylanicum TaxID=53326 RepID=A0A016WFV2_9BILA|nr:hypothetical protein Y032_0758g2106 [Ancylostoma ceylanicum]